MALPAGTRLGPYEIVTPIGAGGMGEVYRARDTRLDRDVAVKVLPASFSNDADRLRRFEQEARAAGILNHPNITAVYDVGTLDGSPYVVQELLEGETLRGRLGGGPLAPRRATEYAVQIAHGLAAAHEKGIVHRDLKPENLFVTKDGRVKILDFGLAKLTQTAESGPQTNLPTAAARTEPGVVMGTLGYMSPEQVRGKPADARSDIFSFGAILYEMLSGKRAFHRDTAADTMSAILREDPPDLSSTNRQVSPALDRIIRHCLEKDPEARFHSAHDLAFHLQEPATDASVTLSSPRSPGTKLRPVPIALAAIALALVASLAFLAARRPRDDRPLQAVRFAIPIPPGTTYAPPEISRAISISPDGTRLVIEAYSSGKRRLFLRPLGSEKTTELEGTSGASAHFWSPDSRFIAFFADGKLKKIPAAGGPAEVLCEASFNTVGTWNAEGTILFTQILTGKTNIFRVSDKGGQPVGVMTPGSAAQLWPHFLPDGRRFLYLAGPGLGPGSREVRVGSLDSSESRVVANVDSRVEYAAPGYLLFAREGALFAQPFDEKKAVISGEPALLAEGIDYFFGPANASFSVSPTGVVAYETMEPPARMAWFDRQGREIGALGQPAVVDGLRISPRGDRVAVDVGDSRTGSSDIWVFELSSGVSTRLHADATDEILPLWSPDGSKVIFRADRKGPPDIYEMMVGSQGSQRPLLEQVGVQQPEDVTRDGRLMVYLHDVQSVTDIWMRPLQGESKSFPWLQSQFIEKSPRFSPDGRWIAYESDESGAAEIYVALTEGAGEKRRLSPAGGSRPRWRADGRELYYLAPGGVVMAVPVTGGAQLTTGAPAPLFRVEPGIRNYDVAPDGSRFLVLTPVEKVPESPLRVILNWTAAIPTTRSP